MIHSSVARTLHALLLCLTSLVVFSSRAAVAQDNLGTADYAMLHPKWPCRAVRESETGLRTLRKAVLWNTFGTETSCLKEYLSDPRLVVLEVHLINEPCARNKNCGTYEFLHGVTPEQYDKQLLARDPALIKRLQEYLAVPAKLLATSLQEHTKCYISPGLESNISKDAAKALHELVRPLFPKCEIVWNPVNNSRYASPIAGTTFELHGSKVSLESPCIADLDGEDISFPSRPAILPNFLPSTQLPSYTQRFSSCAANFLWTAEYNGITKGPFVDPRKRENFPGAELLKLISTVLSTG